MARVGLDKFVKRWAGSEGVGEIDLDIPDGEFWVLVGPSGCGKSTVLRAIAGLETPTSGNIFIGDRLANAIPARQRDVAMVFQNYALYPHMTVAENLAFGLKMRHTDAAVMRDRVLTVAKSLGLETLLQRKPGQLSGGQQQRVALGRAIAREPQVFLLDEPLSNLDAQLREDARAELKLLHQRLGVTTIYVTHDRLEAMTLADRIVVLDRGRVQQVGSPSAVYHAPQNLMVATFLGNPGMNAVAAIYNGSAFEIDDQTIPMPPAWEPTVQSAVQSARDRHFILGIRPEHLRLGEPDSAVTTSEGTLRVQIATVEPLGSETLIRATALRATAANSSHFLQIKVPGIPTVRPHETLNLRFVLENLLLFDPATGNRLG